jgi:hypothetical protein
VTKRIRKEVETSRKPLSVSALQSTQELVIIAETSLIIIASQLVILSLCQTETDEIHEELGKEYEATLNELNNLLTDAIKVWGSVYLEDSKLFVGFLSAVLKG